MSSASRTTSVYQSGKFSAFLAVKPSLVSFFLSLLPAPPAQAKAAWNRKQTSL